ncbi:MAG: bifunctional 23S rRNA (guanine(2069)-N(7))-methyltransferase RlmK/23S rRNA (guanine(2445)-N(2))-methyltransferase RlmL [Sphaerochaeta sp.]|uniref:bifunctional 23S rRNA (guanine(2069)-N(7))-methyltransferase RlmK/23S rRNA (guanine(2445)-N(2))-methyltransferase RlmL n=1 Tax=Sphaerochaeta sp. TaxID=1972642 RepID=UPI001D2BBFFD|nr:bifunctional 23S rRNA (guanine(2069)-N(7))-methyltransferase RlmK/23S rRNA (guanine(2445)-N(2))-methyltransferase RlmL [Sphaerochaeta sp.]MDD3928554.1 bifunctional 23S rRNA (guanine(2069)-N(7))-methyltransferase RlmK/23S rRNA (guanine(2445)-N(2))-methyltransferase RlmL [Sphaerochaeta sp.]NCC12012.1 bifunctional 23S rRNA (guanine(2069)-N(7))-methyltransferase RlmK/23S rRNA (guanine(2445)-N(2))-methyltransferase RlmL [Spirochaetia bacterium]NCC88992.1 bifunctional 23S rRNA (guanine(2069)-N(7))-
MIFFATSALYMNDIIEEEARQAGATDIRSVSGGVEFSADLASAYRFCLWSRTATRVMMGLFQDEDILTADELYEASVQIPWEDWVNPNLTFSVTETVKNCPYMKNSHFAAIRLKDAIVDRIREKFEGERPLVDKDESDVVFHVHIEGEKVAWYVDFSGRGLHKRGYRVAQTDAVLSEYLASSVIYRSEWRKALDKEEGVPTLLDPFCGSGTLAIEAALWAGDRAPGLVSARRFNFFDLPIHDPDLYEEVVDEALLRAEQAKDRKIAIYAWDSDPKAVAITKKHAQLAQVDHLITFAVKDFTKVTKEDVPAETGYIITDPPYGLRMEGPIDLQVLYRQMGKQISTLFGGWHAAILCGQQELLSHVDMKPDRTNTVNNGGVTCQIAHYYVFTDEERQQMIERAIERKKERLAQPLSEGAQMAYNRLVKNLAAIKPIMAEQNVTCYRIYDADMPEYSAAIDLYEGKYISLQEYAPPATIDPEAALKRLGELIDATERATGIDREQIYVRQRTPQKGEKQYEKMASTDKFYIINENGAKYLVNFTDYLDTGIFLDHRPIRAQIAQLAEGKRFLNLFCYTGTATVQAAKGGALSTVSVDASSTYLDWAVKNMQLNGYTEMNHFFYRSDCLQFLFDTYDRYDLIFCDPPTFSNGKGRDTFDVDRDQVRLIKACMMHLDQKGTLIFSCNYRKFSMDERLLDEFDVQDITATTIAEDFARDQKIHYTFLIKHRTVVKVQQPKSTMKLVRRK